MARAWNSKSVSLEDGILTFLQPGSYAFETMPHGKVKIVAEDGQSTVLSASDFAGITAVEVPAGSSLTLNAAQAQGWTITGAGEVNVEGVAFVTADEAADGKFEPTVDLDDLIGGLLAENGVAATLEALSVNGSQADAIRLVWDHLDDNYSYYNTAINDAFVDLGLIYADYLKDGGEALLDVVKFAPDSLADADLAPERLQSMHDNILGNFHEPAITDRFGAAGDDVIFQRIVDAGHGALIGAVGVANDGRPYYGGYDHENPTATRAFDDGYFF